MVSVRDAVAVVTGGASGIGAALARRFAAEGAAAVVVADLDEAAAGRLAGELPVGHGLAVDAGDQGSLTAALAWIEEEIGPVDIWCSNAGVAAGPGLGDDADWQRCWRLHVHAHLLAARHVLPRMVARGHGHLLVTASAAGLLTELDSAPYAVTKHASVALAEWLAIQHHGGVSVSCLCPQAVRTPMLAGAPASSATLAGAVIAPEQVADAVMAAFAEDRFLILPHPEVAEYERRRATDRDRWLSGMRRLRARLRARPGA